MFKLLPTTALSDRAYNQTSVWRKFYRLYVVDFLGMLAAKLVTDLGFFRLICDTCKEAGWSSIS